MDSFYGVNSSVVEFLIYFIFICLDNYWLFFMFIDSILDVNWSFGFYNMKFKFIYYL